MKKSELKAEIKEYIVEILSEVDEATYVGAGAVADIQKDPSFSKIKDKASAINTLKAGESVTLEEEDEDREPTKAELEKEKVKGANAKKTISDEKFEDFKTKLKNVVKKIKDMKKGKERDDKMVALKQFIKNPELVKAFKERDVQIDTDGLVR